jgi:hypothetical protein
MEEVDPKKPCGGNISVILDYVDFRSKYNYPVANENTTMQVNNALNASIHNESSAKKKNTSKVSTQIGIDAFGDSYSKVGKSMPPVKLDGGFSVKLRAMFDKQPSQYRYKTIGDSSYPITLENRARLKKALEYISDIDRKDVFWVKVDTNEIAFVFPDKLPKIPPKFAALFSSDKNADEARFAAIAEQFIMAFRALPPEQKPDNICMFNLRKMDKSRCKVVYNNTRSAKEIVQAATAWQEGFANLPPIDIIEIKTPFPLQVANIANKVWKQNGERVDTNKSTVKLMQYYQGIELLIDPPCESWLVHLLRGVLANYSGLAVFVGNKLFRKECKDEHKSSIGEMLALAGFLLYKSGYKKEDYMESMAYLLGQVLKISDGLHELYCKVKRKGDVPPQLAGTGMFVTATETPNRALAQLGVRMCPYISWAKQYITLKDEAGNYLSERRLVIDYLRNSSETASKLHHVLTESTRFNDYEKAQLFIGYLAALPKKSDENSSTKEEEAL